MNVPSLSFKWMSLSSICLYVCMLRDGMAGEGEVRSVFVLVTILQ